VKVTGFNCEHSSTSVSLVIFNSLAAAGLLFQACADRIELSGRTELFVFVRHEIGVPLNKDLPWPAKIELLGMIAEVFAMNSFPDEPAELDDKRGPALDISPKETEQLFHVVDVVGADGELAVSDLVKLNSSDNHLFKREISILPAGGERAQNLIPKS
jgi:hypothetical protein